MVLLGSVKISAGIKAGLSYHCWIVNFQKITLFSSKLTVSSNNFKTIYKNTKITRTQQGKIPNIQHLNKNFQTYQEENIIHNEGETNQ